MMCGGTGEEQAATEEVQTLIEGVKDDVQKKSGKTFSVYKAVTYKTQVVAGTNYFVKVDVGSSQFAHLRIFRPLPHTGGDPELHSYQLDKTESDALDYF